MPNVPSSYEVNWQLVTGNGSLKPICSLSNSSLLLSLAVFSSWWAKRRWLDIVFRRWSFHPTPNHQSSASWWWVVMLRRWVVKKKWLNHNWTPLFHVGGGFVIKFRGPILRVTWPATGSDDLNFCVITYLYLKLTVLILSVVIEEKHLKSKHM